MAGKLSENPAFVDIVDKADDSITTKLTSDSTLDSGRLEIVVSYQVNSDGDVERFFSSSESFISTAVQDVTQ